MLFVAIHEKQSVHSNKMKGGHIVNDKQRELIKELRIKGMGYRLIGKELGLSRDVVRNYCISHGLSGYAGNNEKVKGKRFVMRENVGINCLMCRKELEQKSTGRPKKFCSESCRRRWWSVHQDLLTRNQKSIYKAVCHYCGKEFESYGNQKRKYCSHHCYILDRFGPADIK